MFQDFILIIVNIKNYIGLVTESTMLSDSREPKHPRIDPASYYNQQNYFANANFQEENLIMSDSDSTPSSSNQTGNEQEQNINDECKVCVVLSKPGDLACILNQGLYHKYTSSQDFFYTKDITSLIEKKRSEFAINYYDDKIFDEDKEHLKQFFKRKDSKALMDEIKNFYSQFYNFPRNFHKDFFKLVNTNIVRHRRLEYIKVFHNSTLPQDQSTEQNAGDIQNNFDFMNMLGETFLKENDRDISEIARKSQKPGQRRETEQYISEVENNFNLLKHLAPDKKHIENSEAKVSNALYNRQFMLYSRNDSEAAEEMIKDVLEGFQPEPKRVLTRKKSGDIKVMRTKKPESETEITTTATTENKKPLPLQSQSRQQSPGKILQISQNFVSKDILKELNGANNVKKETDYLTDRILGNNTKSDTTRATLVDHSESNKMGRQDSTPNFHSVNRPKPLNIPKKSIKTSVPLMKFTIESLKESLVDKESILSKVNQLRTTQNKPINFRAEELKIRTPNSVPNKPLIISGDPFSAGSAKPKHLRVSYLYSPNTLQTPSAETLLLKKRDGKSSKILRPRPEIKPASEARGSKSGLHHRDSSGPGFFDLTKTNRNSQNSRIFEVESPGIRPSVTLRTAKSSTKLVSKQMGRSTPSSIIDNKFEAEIINSKNHISSVCFEPPRNEKKKLSMERKPSQEPLESTEREGYMTKQSRSMSSGIQKLRIEASSPEKKRTKSHLKGNKSISGLYPNMLDLSQGFTPLIDPRMLIRHKGSDFNQKGQRTPELSSSQHVNIRKRKSKSNANTIYYPASVSKADLSGKETKKASLALEEEDLAGSAGRASPARDDPPANFWSPKITKRILHKDKILVKPNTVKGTKHIRYQSRG